jgi:hypothetical protein
MINKKSLEIVGNKRLLGKANSDEEEEGNSRDRIRGWDLASQNILTKPKNDTDDSSIMRSLGPNAARVVTMDAATHNVPVDIDIPLVVWGVQS